MKLKRIQTDKPWGKALEKLRICSKRKISINTFEKRNVMKRGQYRAILRSKQGPRVATLDRLLNLMKCSWHDWASAYQPVPGKQEKDQSGEE